MPAHRPIAERFWEKVEQLGPDECWPWRGSKDRDGYGRISLRDQQFRAHRTAWELANGRSSNDDCVCHSCDNPACVNPAHLWLGTHADNMRDRREKNQQRKEQ